MLVQGMARDLIERGGIRAVEAFGDTRGPGHRLGPGLRCVPPWTSSSVGFKTQRAHADHPRMRMELRPRSPGATRSRRRWSGCSASCAPARKAAAEIGEAPSRVATRTSRDVRWPGRSARRLSDEVGELVEQRGLGAGADDRLHDLAALVDVDRRDAGDAVGRRGDGVLVDVHLQERDLVAVLALAISSRIGATWRHGPHHSAQKSTRTGLSDLRTCGLELGVGHGSDVRHGAPSLCSWVSGCWQSTPGVRGRLFPRRGAGSRTRPVGIRPRRSAPCSVSISASARPRGAAAWRRRGRARRGSARRRGRRRSRCRRR